MFTSTVIICKHIIFSALKIKTVRKVKPHTLLDSLTLLDGRIYALCTHDLQVYDVETFKHLEDIQLKQKNEEGVLQRIFARSIEACSTNHCLYMISSCTNLNCVCRIHVQGSDDIIWLNRSHLEVIIYSHDV